MELAKRVHLEQQAERQRRKTQIKQAKQRREQLAEELAAGGEEDGIDYKVWQGPIFRTIRGLEKQWEAHTPSTIAAVLP